MTEHKLDITGKICPYCLLLVRKKVKTISSGDKLVVMTDHPPAATDTIPHDMKKQGNDISSEKVEPGLWKLIITKK
ncbi:MAG: sulfurtransferase TusA family protein [Candidatus Lokiarchaeota archaeon]|nr:sulfurtransferase TusA family protein [Candidatus Lokiarchaeota archaeon]MBD3339478.1 sulfurtransferase TusA family protein [Candidatus Lokiarchaeota archaeon]